MARDMIARILDNEWVEDAATIDQRKFDAVKPRIVVENTDKRLDMNNDPICEVKIGESENDQFKTRGHAYRREKDRVVISLKFTDQQPDDYSSAADSPDEFMYGYMAGPNGDSDFDLRAYERVKYGGLVGETKRIMNTHTSGVGKYNELVVVDIDDQCGETDYGIWHADVVVELRRYTEPGWSTVDAHVN